MRYLFAVSMVLVACGADPGDGDGGVTSIADASTEVCPLVGTEGVVRANWYRDVGCVYLCNAATHQRCGDRANESGLIMGGVCVAQSDPHNCGGCGIDCGPGNVCAKPAGSAFYVCLGRQP